MADKPPAMREDLRKALQAQIQDLIGGEEVQTHQFMKVAEVARLGAELSRALAVRPEKKLGGGLGQILGGYGPIIGGAMYGDDDENVPNSPNGPETFGATIVRELVSTLQEHTNRPSLGSLINGIAAARENGMGEVADALQQRLSDMIGKVPKLPADGPVASIPSAAPIPPALSSTSE